MDEIINPTSDKESIKAVNDGEPIYTEDGILVGSKSSHFQKSESVIPNGDIHDAVVDDDSRYYFSKEIQKEFQ